MDFLQNAAILYLARTMPTDIGCHEYAKMLMEQSGKERDRVKNIFKEVRYRTGM
jgi:hypothetical protein